MYIQFLLYTFFLAKALRLWFLVDTAIGTKFEFPTARVAELSSILGGYAVCSGKWLPTFRGGKKKKNFACNFTVEQSYMVYSFTKVYTEKGITTLRNAYNYLPVSRE